MVVGGGGMGGEGRGGERRGGGVKVGPQSSAIMPISQTSKLKISLYIHISLHKIHILQSPSCRLIINAAKKGFLPVVIFHKT